MKNPNVDPVALDHQIAAGQTELIGGDTSAFMNEVNEKKGSFDPAQMKAAGEPSGDLKDSYVAAAFDVQDRDSETTPGEITDPVSAEKATAEAAQKQRQIGDLASNGYGAEVVPVEVTENPSVAQAVPVNVEKPQA